MLKDSTMPKKLVEIASEIVQTQVSVKSMSAGEIALSLRQVFSTLHELQKAEAAGIEMEVTQPPQRKQAPTKLTPQDSIQNDKVICLECGAEMRLLIVKTSGRPRHGPERVQEEIWLYCGDPFGCKVIDQSQKQSGKKEGIA